MPSIVETFISVMPETSRLASGIRDAVRDAERTLPRISVDVEADTSAARAEIDRLEDQRVTVKVDVDRSELDRLFGGGGSGGGGSTGFGGGGGGIGGPLLKVNAGLVGIGLLPAAATALTDVAAAVQQVAGAGLALPGVFAGIVGSVGTAALGMQGMGDAFDAVTQAADGTEASVTKANDALAKLSPNAADVVTTFVGLKDTFAEVQSIASQNMFEGVADSAKSLVGESLPEVTRGIDGISRGLNQNILQALSSLGSGSSQGLLDRILGNTGEAQSRLTAAIDPMISAFGTLTAAGTDSLPRLADAVTSVATRFNAFITTADGDGRLDEWISEGLDGFTSLGNTLLNVGKAFTAITEAAGGGTGLLGTLESATSRMQLFFNSTEGQEQLKQFFYDGRMLLGQLRDVAAELGPILREVFSAGLSAAQVWLPTIREVLEVINQIPGGANAVVTAFLAWRTLSGVTTLASTLNSINNVLGVTMPQSADKGAKGISAALASITIPAALAAFLNNSFDVNKDDFDPTKSSWGHILFGPGYDKIFPTEDPPPLVPGGGGPNASRERRGYDPIDPTGGLLLPAGGPTPPGPVLPRPVPPAVQAATPSLPIPAVSDYVAPAITESSGGSSAASGTRNVIVSPQNIQEAINAAAEVSGNPYGYGGVGPGSMSEDGAGLYDCSGFMSDLYAILTGKPYDGNERYFTTESDFTSLGFVKGFDPNSPFNIGVHNGGGGRSSHMAGTLAGVNVESGSSGTLFGGQAAGANDAQFESQYHLPTSYDTSLNSWYAGANPAMSDALAAALGSKANPMYVDYTEGSKFSQKDSGGNQLGQDLVGGVMELFGIDGSVFPNFMNTGMFKTSKALTSFLTGMAGGGQPGGSDGASLAAPGGDLLGGALNAAQGFIPQAFGQLNVGGQDRVPTGSVHQPGGAPGPGGPGAGDYRIQQTFNGPVGSASAAFNAAKDANIPRMRQGIRPLPK